jgi:hypothetical protein
VLQPTTTAAGGKRGRGEEEMTKKKKTNTFVIHEEFSGWTTMTGQVPDLCFEKREYVSAKFDAENGGDKGREKRARKKLNEATRRVAAQEKRLEEAREDFIASLRREELPDYVDSVLRGDEMELPNNICELWDVPDGTTIGEFLAEMETL